MILHRQKPPTQWWVAILRDGRYLRLKANRYGGPAGLHAIPPSEVKMVIREEAIPR